VLARNIIPKPAPDCKADSAALSTSAKQSSREIPPPSPPNPTPNTSTVLLTDPSTLQYRSTTPS
jgi:hypothetical protein